MYVLESSVYLGLFETVKLSFILGGEVTAAISLALSL